MSQVAAKSPDARATGIWKDDWDQARTAFNDWWDHKGLAISIAAPRDQPWADFPPAPAGASLETRWLDPDYRVAADLHRLSHTYFGGVAMPVFQADIGPGSLGLFLDGIGHLSDETVWYEPSITPEDEAPLRVDKDGVWWKRHLALLLAAKPLSAGRFLMGYPDLIENIDTLAQLRGSQELVVDLLDRPEWVLARLDEILVAYFDAYDTIYDTVGMQDQWGGTVFNAFGLWAPGRVAKVQCDFSCLISPRMYRKFVTPTLTEQCRRLDCAMYHLDGTQAVCHLDNLLAIDEIDAIEWTPQAGLPQGGSPEWYDLYRRIKAGGKSVQAVCVAPDEVEPLIDAVGGEGMMICTWETSEQRARALLERCGWNPSRA